MLDKSYFRTIFHLGSRCVLHEGTEGVNAGNILLFNENTLSKCKFVLTIRKSEELKYSSIVLPESIDTDDLLHCHNNNEKRLENDGEVAHRIKQC